jgi:hypothetical protein
MRLTQHLLPYGTKQYWQWSETAVITLGALGVSYAAVPTDPLNTGMFPWVWMVPLLIALRYGVLMGAVSVLLFLIGWLSWASHQHINLADFPKLTFLGGTLMMMISGEFSSMWITRVRRTEELQSYTEQRLELLTRRLYLLSLSHDRLEQDLIGRRASLREGLKALNCILPAPQGLAGAELYMRLVVRQCNLSVAGLHAVENLRINPVAAASMGAFTPIDVQDPLIEHCLRSGDLVHINMEENLTRLPSRYLVAVPAKTADGRIVAVMAVEKMPFFALQTTNMQTLAVLTSYYADTISASAFLPLMTEKIKDCPIDFFTTLKTLRHLQRDMQISSMLVGFITQDADEGAEQLKIIAGVARGLDETWIFTRGESRICLVLLTLAGDTALNGYLDRIVRLFVERLGESPGKLGISTRWISLDNDPIVGRLEAFIESLIEHLNHHDADH